MLLALLFLLIGLTVGAVVLTAASAAAGHGARVRQEQQNYLAVSSAARLLEKDLAGAAFHGAYTGTYTETYVEAEVDPETGEVAKPAETVVSDTVFKRSELPNSVTGSTLLKETEKELQAVYASTQADLGPPAPPAPASAEYALRFSGEKGLPEVTGTLTIAPADGPGTPVYAITAVLQTEGGYAMTLRFQPQVTEDSDTARSTAGSVSTTVTTYTTTVTWDGPAISKGGGI